MNTMFKVAIVACMLVLEGVFPAAADVVKSKDADGDIIISVPLALKKKERFTVTTEMISDGIGLKLVEDLRVQKVNDDGTLVWASTLKDVEVDAKGQVPAPFEDMIRRMAGALKGAKLEVSASADGWPEEVTNLTKIQKKLKRVFSSDSKKILEAFRKSGLDEAQSKAGLKIYQKQMNLLLGGVPIQVNGMLLEGARDINTPVGIGFYQDYETTLILNRYIGTLNADFEIPSNWTVKRVEEEVGEIELSVEYDFNDDAREAARQLVVNHYSSLIGQSPSITQNVVNAMDQMVRTMRYDFAATYVIDTETGMPKSVTYKKVVTGLEDRDNTNTEATVTIAKR